jgi:hypothetical protein
MEVRNPSVEQPMPWAEVQAWFNGRTLPIRPGIPARIFRDYMYHLLRASEFRIYALLGFDGRHAREICPTNGRKIVMRNGSPQIHILWSNLCTSDRVPPIRHFDFPGLYHIGNEFVVLRQGKAGLEGGVNIGSMCHRISMKFNEYHLPDATAVMGIVTDPGRAYDAEKKSRAEYFRLTGGRLT